MTVLKKQLLSSLSGKRSAILYAGGSFCFLIFLVYTRFKVPIELREVVRDEQHNGHGIIVSSSNSNSINRGIVSSSAHFGAWNDSTRLPPPQNLLFIKIPKVGGTTFAITAHRYAQLYGLRIGDPTVYDETQQKLVDFEKNGS